MSRARELSNSSWASTSSQDSPYAQPAYYSQHYTPSPALCPPGQQQPTAYAYPSPGPSPVLDQGEEAFYPAAAPYHDSILPAPRFAPQAPQAAYSPPTPDPSSSSSFSYSHGYPPAQHHDAQPLQYPPSAYRQLAPLPQPQQRAIPPLMRQQPLPPSRGPSPPAHQYYTTERLEQGWTPVADSRPSPYDRPHQHNSSPYGRPAAEYQHRGMVAPAPYGHAHEYRNDSYPLPLLPVPPAPLSYDQRSMSEGSPRGSDRSFGSDEDRHEAITPFVSKLAHLLNHPEYSEVIRWNREGTAFTFAHGSPELLTVFSRFFRHSNVHSFVRQLNIYSFTRLSTIDLLDALEGSAPSPNTEFSGFFHPLLFRDSPGHVCDLSKIKPKASKKKPSLQKLNAHLAPEVRKRSVKVEGKIGGGMKHRKL